MKHNNPRKQSSEVEQIISYLLQNGGTELIDRIHTFSVGLFVKYYTKLGYFFVFNCNKKT